MARAPRVQPTAMTAVGIRCRKRIFKLLILEAQEQSAAFQLQEALQRMQLIDFLVERRGSIQSRYFTRVNGGCFHLPSTASAFGQ
jgi:hypothetical protein